MCLCPHSSKYTLNKISFSFSYFLQSGYERTQANRTPCKQQPGGIFWKFRAPGVLVYVCVYMRYLSIVFFLLSMCIIITYVFTYTSYKHFYTKTLRYWGWVRSSEASASSLAWSQKCRWHSLRADTVFVSILYYFFYIFFSPFKILWPICSGRSSPVCGEGVCLPVWLEQSHQLDHRRCSCFPQSDSTRETLCPIISKHLPWRYKSHHSLLLSHTPQSKNT